MRIVGGNFRSRRFNPPANIKARPTTDFARENLFNVLENRMDFEEIRALDLFAGTGAISFELLSRGCPSVVCVEAHSIQYNFIKKVMHELCVTDSLTPVKGDVFRFIHSSSAVFDFIFADPPYDLADLPKIPRLILDSSLLSEEGWFVLEHSRKDDFSSLPEFDHKRTYGSVNFSFFRKLKK